MATETPDRAAQSRDSAKRQGDKLGVARGDKPAPEIGSAGRDSPKPHGDKLGHAVKEAGKG